MNCKNCGNHIEPGVKTCIFCGHPVENDQTNMNQNVVNQNNQVEMNNNQNVDSNQVNSGYQTNDLNNGYQSNNVNQVPNNQMNANYQVNNANQYASEGSVQTKSSGKKTIIIIVILAVVAAVLYFVISAVIGSKTVDPMLNSGMENSARSLAKDFNSQVSTYCSSGNGLDKYVFYKDSSKTSKTNFDDCKTSSCYLELTGSYAKDFAMTIGSYAADPAYISMTINKCVVESACLHYTVGQFEGIKMMTKSSENITVEKGTCN